MSQAASAAGGEPEYELQSVNFHSGFFGEKGTLKTFEVPHNITLINIGTFGAYTCDPLGGNISQKTASGIDLGSSGNPNTPLDEWIVEHFSVRDRRFGDLCILLPGTQSLDRYMAHDKNALIEGTEQAKSMVYRTRESLKGYYSFSQIHDAVNIERTPGGPATRMQDTPDAFPEFGIKGIPFSIADKTLELSELCKWISENANGKNIILFVLGCQVMPNDISLSTIRTIDESKRIKNVEILENVLVGLSLGRQVVHLIQSKTSTIKTRSDRQTETQEALADADEKEGGVVYHAERDEYAASEWKYPPDLWTFIASAAGLSPHIRLEEGLPAFNKKINSGVYLTDEEEEEGEKIADVIIEVSRSAVQEAMDVSSGAAGYGGGKRKRRRKTRKKKTKKNRKRNHKTKKRKRKRNKRTRRNNSTMKLRN